MWVEPRIRPVVKEVSCAKMRRLSKGRERRSVVGEGGEGRCEGCEGCGVVVVVGIVDIVR